MTRKLSCQAIGAQICATDCIPLNSLPPSCTLSNFPTKSFRISARISVTSEDGGQDGELQQKKYSPKNFAFRSQYIVLQKLKKLKK
jgi:hypothetical protein